MTTRQSPAVALTAARALPRTARAVPGLNDSLNAGIRRTPLSTTMLTTRANAACPAPATVNPEVARALGLPVQSLAAQRAAVGGVDVTPQQQAALRMNESRAEEELPQLAIEKSLVTIFSTEELLAQGFPVTNDKLFGPGSVNNPQMGVTEPGKICPTCEKDNIQCPGHMGYIKMARPVYHPLGYQFIIQILTCVCRSCGGLLLTATEIHDMGLDRLFGGERLRAIADASTGVKCRVGSTTTTTTEATTIVRCNEKGPATITTLPPGVAAPMKACVDNPVYSGTKLKETGKIIAKAASKARGTNQSDQEICIEEVQSIFNAISQTDAELLGFRNGSHPKRLVVNLFPVIPPIARPPGMQDGVMLTDHLTTMYQGIVKINNSLADEKDQVKYDTLYGYLHVAIRNFIDNTDSANTQSQQKEMVALKKRIQGKEAIIRGFLMGKRVNYSGRTVIGPDPSLKFGQARIPEVWAPVLTPTVTINNINRQAMTGLLRAGKVSWITWGSGKLRGKRQRVDKTLQDTGSLNIGDKIERWLQNGDRVILNRQPTLHKQGMMGHEVVLGKQMTIGLHLSETTPYNADFELSMH